MWFKNKNEETEKESPVPGGIEFEDAAARVTAAEDPEEDSEDPEISAAADGFVEEMAGEEESLIIKPEWAQECVKVCFYPAAKFVHPAYALTDEQAEKVAPKMAAFLQAVSDKYLPLAVSRLANKYPEFWDLAAAIGVLYYQQWRMVSKIVAEEARRAENAKRVAGVRVMPAPAEQPAEDPTADGAIVI